MRTFMTGLLNPRMVPLPPKTRNSSVLKLSMPTHVSYVLLSARRCLLNPNTVIKLKLANSTEAELKSLQSSLHVAKDDTASDLQRSVFKKYSPYCIKCHDYLTSKSAMRNSYSFLKKSQFSRTKC